MEPLAAVVTIVSLDVVANVVLATVLTSMRSAGRRIEDESPALR